MTNQKKPRSKNIIAKAIVATAVGLLGAKTLLLTTVEVGTVGVRFSSASGVVERGVAGAVHIVHLPWSWLCLCEPSESSRLPTKTRMVPTLTLVW